MLHKTANLDNCSDEFDNNWINILSRASGELRDLVLRECRLVNETTVRNILKMEECLVKEYGSQVRDGSNEKIREICGKLKESLTVRRRTKLDKLCDIKNSTNQEEPLTETPIEFREILDRPLAPSSSQIDRFLAEVRVEETQILVEDVGPEENLEGINPLPIDSPLLLTDVVNEVRSLNESGHERRGVVDEIATPNETSEGNITDQARLAEPTSYVRDPIGLGIMNDRVYSEGLHVVVNLSSRTLTEAENSLLSKGLSFCPTPAGIDTYTLKKDVLEYVRRIRLKEYFYKDDDVDGNFSDVPAFRKRSQWCPEKNRDIFLEAYATALERKIFESDLNTKNYRNLTKEEQQALEALRKCDDIVIKQADKGSGVVIMDRTRYVAEAMRQLSDVGVYVALDKDPTNDMSKKVNNRLRKARDDRYISESTLEYLLVNGTAKAGRFYLLPKIHKTGCPGRPVISGCNTPTERISEFVDHHLKPLITSIPSFVKDTNDFLHKLKNMETLPESAILVSLDVVGLYPHIPHAEGLEAIRQALNEREDQEMPTNLIVDLAELVLKNNNFEFNGNHYLQTLGTAIGTKMAPAYANLFMDRLERRLISESRVKPYLWLRYIDDIFMVWTGSEEELGEFLNYINEAHETIKFTWTWSKERVNYLDVQVINTNGKIETDLYTKPTDKHQFLSYTSCHPRGCKQGIPYAQALRLRRICSTNAAFEKRASELSKFLVARGYQKRFVREQIRKARSKTREEALTPASQKTTTRVPMVVTYHPNLPNIGYMLRELQPLLHCSDKCKKAVKEVPMVAFRRPKSLRDYLVHAKLRATNLEERPKGTVKCGDRRCQVCKHLKIGDSFTSKRTGKQYSINSDLNCNSTNVVYLLSCKVCGVQYVGSTTTRFRLRFNNHKSRIRAHSRLSLDDKSRDDLIYQHFCGPAHNGIEDVSIQLIDQVNNDNDLLDREGQWAYRLKSVKPHGLNESDFFFSQNKSSRVRKN